MKASRILLFIFSVIALLAVLCSFFPREGVRVGSTTLEFPALSDILNEEPEDPGESPEELLEKRMEAIREAQKNDYLAYFRNDPARFYFPGDSIELFDRFFASLDRADSRQVRIMHYGDSQLEEDRITMTIRNFLQERFGGGGGGLLPVAGSYFNKSYSVAASYDVPYRLVYAQTQEMRAGHNRYGPLGRVGLLSGPVTVTVSPLGSNKNPSRYYNRMTVLVGNRYSDATVTYKGQTKTVKASENVSRFTFELPDSTSKASVSISGAEEIYGVSVDNATGVTMDNIAMRGCSGAIFTAINSNQLREYFNKSNVKLIILQYGGNMVPFTKTDKAIEGYKSTLKKQITYLRKLSPDASILFIGPSDMSTNIGGKMQTYPHLEKIVTAIKEAALESGAAFWDMYGAMGGNGSMAKWVHSSPALAGSDYVHFTTQGSRRMGEIFCESLMLYYDYYKWRKDNGR